MYRISIRCIDKGQNICTRKKNLSLEDCHWVEIGGHSAKLVLRFKDSRTSALALLGCTREAGEPDSFSVQSTMPARSAR